MELYGTVQLNDRSMEELKESIREQVIQEMRESGNTFTEIETFLNDLSYKSYLQMIRLTLPKILRDTKESDIIWSEDKKSYQILNVISGLLSI